MKATDLGIYILINTIIWYFIVSDLKKKVKIAKKQVLNLTILCASLAQQHEKDNKELIKFIDEFSKNL